MPAPDTSSSGGVGRPSWERWAPLSGIVAIALIMIAFFFSGSTPDSGDSDAKIVTYLGSESHQHKQWVAMVIFFVGVLFLLVFFAVLRTRLAAAEGPDGWMTGLMFGAGIATAALWMAAVAFFVAPFLSASNAAALDNASSVAWIYRVSSDGGYALWVGATLCGTLVTGATSAIAFRTRVLPRWFAWVGVVVAVVCLAAVFFIPAFLYFAWIVVAAILLTVPPTARANA